MLYPTITVDPVLIGRGMLPTRYPGESFSGDMSPAYIRHHQGWLESADFAQQVMDTGLSLDGMADVKFWHNYNMGLIQTMADRLRIKKLWWMFVENLTIM